MFTETGIEDGTSTLVNSPSDHTPSAWTKHAWLTVWCAA